MAQPPFRVVIIGGGYAGMLATVRLAGKIKREIQHGNVAITLVNAVDVFVERLRLHQFAANQAIPPRPIGDILRGTGVSFVRGAATQTLHGRAAVVQFVLASTRFLASDAHAEIAEVNGQPAAILRIDRQAVIIIAIEVDRDHVREIRVIGNPDKLRAV